MQDLLERVLKRDRTIVAIALIVVSVLAWGYLLAGAGMDMTAFEMTGHSLMSMEMMDPPEWTIAYALLMFFMWWVMMIAMMLPGATPVILLAAALNRRSSLEKPPFGSTGMFASGYLLAWAGFSLVAVLAQWLLLENDYINTMLISRNPWLSGTLLVLAGVWQFSPWKHACLRHCRSPMELLTGFNSQKRSEAMRIGLVHGAYCLGCCWFLMALLFVGGVMNLYWIAGLAIYVWLEKILITRLRYERLVGAMLVLWGVSVVAGFI